MKIHLSEVHPELRANLSKFPQFTFAAWNLWLLRWLTKLIPASKAPEDVAIENVFIPTPDTKTQIRLRIYRPKTSAAGTPVLVWMHGGGYVIGNPELDEDRCIQYVREAGIVVVSVDYRLAPKYPFPTPLEDNYTALKWVHSHAAQLRIDPTRIAIGGESAGGGLAASLAQLTVDRQEIKTVFQLLVYPMLDDNSAVRPDIAHLVHFNWNQKSNRFGWKAYLGTDAGTANLPEYAIPARRSELSSLPPAWIGVGTLDLFHDEDVAYAQRLKAAGVECEIVVIPGAYHGFDVYDTSQVVHDFRSSQVAALKRYLLPLHQPIT